jgi:hypothetical protein
VSNEDQPDQTGEEITANACLIAAAPELLAALQDALEALEGFLPEDYLKDEEPDQDMRAASNARAVIAKAKGGAA